jgi:polysaccharide deacetylase family protein (PEP-CTERM system associated)
MQMEITKSIFTVDVEEYFHAENILDSLPKEKIAALPSRVEMGTRKLLDILLKYSSTATFFVLGCVAEKHPALIKDIASAGHEIASHGYEHIPLHKHTHQTFDDDLGRSIKILSDITGQKIIGYRATSFSLAPGMEWFFEALKKHGIIYDSSLGLSLFRKHYHSRWAEIFKSQKNLGIMEFAPSYINIGALKLPIGGGYFRAYPYWLTKYGLGQRIPERQTPPLFYIHPWELDPGQPRVKLSPVKYVRHYLELGGTEGKVARLLKDSSFGSIADFLKQIVL